MKKITYFCIISLLTYIGIEMIIHSKAVTESVGFSMDIWKNNIFPSLFPFFVLSNILISYGFINILSKLFHPIMKLFKVSSNSSFIFVMGLISGFPSSAKYTKDLFDNGLISHKEATKVLMFTHFSNPLFIINTIGNNFLSNKQAGFFILIVHYFVNIIIGILFRNFYPVDKKNEITKVEINKKGFGEIMTNSIVSSMNTLILVLGTITFFMVMTTILQENFHFSATIQALISGLIEMTQGLKYVSLLDLSLKIKSILCAVMISFGGFSVHIQIYSIISEVKIKYFPFLISRVIHAIIVGIIMYLSFDYFL